MAENATNNEAKNSNVNYESSVSLTKEKSASPGLYEVKDATRYLIRGEENGLVNENTHSSMVIRQNGQINLSSNTYAQYKLNPSGKAIEESLESVTITNRKKYSTDDIVINEHKLNPFLYEITDMKELSCHYNDKMLVGNFTMFGTVLVKAWEPELKRYVLIRRLARMPMFSPLLNVPEINSALNISDPLKVDHNILAKSDKGYQVNKPLHDKASLIGKAGVDRAGINRNNLQAVSETPASLGANGSAIGGSILPSQSYNASNYKTKYVNTGQGVQDAATYMSDFGKEISGKYVPTWFWRFIIRTEVSVEGRSTSPITPHFNNPGGMDYSPWMSEFGASPRDFVDNGGESHTGAYFPDVFAGLRAEVAWYLQHPGYPEYEKEIRLCIANGNGVANEVARLHTLRYNVGIGENDPLQGAELEKFNNNYNRLYLVVAKEEYEEGVNLRTGDSERK